MDTTVILAQPRVPRLRADVVYVACVGHESANARSRIYKREFFAGTPQIPPQYLGIWRINSPILRWDFAGFVNGLYCILEP